MNLPVPGEQSHTGRSGQHCAIHQGLMTGWNAADEHQTLFAHVWRRLYVKAAVILLQIGLHPID